MSRQIRTLVETLVSPEAMVPQGEMESWRTGPGEAGLPAVALAPSTEEELAQVLAMASEKGWRVLPAGLGTWLEGGGPSDVAVVVSTGRMRAVHEYEPADLTFSAGAGMSLGSLRKTTAPHGQWLPLDPPGGGRGSLGALVATGIRGGLSHLYGTPRDHVLGLTMVSGDGRVLRWGGRVVKNVAGFDLTKLMVGSWGSLGVVTSISARLFPIPESDTTLLIRGPDMSELFPFARAMTLSALPLAGVELMDPVALDGSASVAADGAEASAGLALRLMGSRAQVGEMEARIRSDLAGERVSLDKLGGDRSRSFQENLNTWEDGGDLVIRLCLLPSGLETLLGQVRELESSMADDASTPSRVRVSAHVGAGVVRVAWEGLPDGEGGVSTLVSALRKLRDDLEGAGGSLTLSSGPGELVKRVGAWGGLGEERRIMLGLKSQFDPAAILAPGRLGL